MFLKNLKVSALKRLHFWSLYPVLSIVLKSLKYSAGDTALIIGAGPIGLLHLMLLKHKGAKVMMTGLEEDRLKTAKKLGADIVFHPSETAGQVRDFTHGMGMDYVFECTGQPAVWESSADYVRRGGTVVLFGGCKKDTNVTFSAERTHYDEITLKGIFHFTPQDVKKAFSLLKNNEIDVKQLITSTCSLKDLPAVFPLLAKGKGIKYAVVPGASDFSKLLAPAEIDMEKGHARFARNFIKELKRDKKIQG